jgi:hypothetical protein
MNTKNHETAEYSALFFFFRRNRATIACTFMGAMGGALIGYSQFGILSHIDQTVRLIIVGDLIGTLVGAAIKDYLSDNAVDLIFSALWLTIGLFSAGQIIRFFSKILIGNWAAVVGVSVYASVLFLCIAKTNGSSILGWLSLILSIVPVVVFFLDGNLHTFAPAISSAAIGVYLIHVSTRARVRTPPAN